MWCEGGRRRDWIKLSTGEVREPAGFANSTTEWRYSRYRGKHLCAWVRLCARINHMDICMYVKFPCVTHILKYNSEFCQLWLRIILKILLRVEMMGIKRKVLRTVSGLGPVKYQPLLLLHPQLVILWRSIYIKQHSNMSRVSRIFYILRYKSNWQFTGKII